MQSDITKRALKRTTYERPAFFYSSAREGMLDLLRNVLQPGRSVALPAFIGWSPNEGSGVFDPVEESGVDRQFYDLNRDLTVDLSSLTELLEEGGIGVMVVIHYFGRTDPAWQEVRRLADEHGVFLVEDLAHGWFSALAPSPSGTYGDAQLYSLHKMLPFADGGMVTYRSAEFVSQQASTELALPGRMLGYDTDAISAHRRSVFAELTASLGELARDDDRFELMWPELGDDVPQTLPVRIKNADRNDVYHYMNAHGVGMVSLYHTLIPQLPPGFGEVRSISREIINFPVHQDVDPSAVKDVVSLFREALNFSQAEAQSQSETTAAHPHLATQPTAERHA